MAENNSVTYLYRDDKLSPALVHHVFQYISAISGIIFVEDFKKPAIFSGDDQHIPESAWILIPKNELSKTQIKDPISGNWISGINCDPISEIASKLSFRGKSGQYSYRPALPSGPNEKTLCGLVTEFINLLCHAGLIENRVRPISLWPEPARFGMAITHDIDIAGRSVAGSVKLLFNRTLPGGWGALFDSIKSALKLAPNPYNAVNRWNDLESELGIKSTYYIFDGRRRHKLDPKYKLNMLSNALDKIRNSGHEIALHTSIESYSGNDLLAAKSRLEQSSSVKLSGLRPHYLSAFYPEYWRAASEAGFAYSSALGFDSDIGWREGLDIPFYPYDSVRGDVIPLLEIPIAIMDCGLIRDIPADSEQVFERAMFLIDSTAAASGFIVMDWHQRTFYNRDYPGWSDLFTKIVHYARGKGACFYRMDGLAAHFMKRFEI